MNAEPGAPTRRRSGSRLEDALSVLKQKFGDRLSTGQAVRDQHAHTLTWIPSQAPDAVVFATSAEDIADVVGVCSAYNVPLVPFGAGTSLEGHVNAAEGGVSLDVSQMNAILDVNVEDLDCRVEPGVTREQLNAHLRDTGLFFSVDPGAGHATLGGMAATRASGTTAVRYGTMRENVLSLKAVMADGKIVRTARRARKSSAGYDLTRLLVGSEGTLGVITELTLRLHGQPESILAAVCPFDTIEGACNATMAAIQLGLGLARVEFLDSVQVKACNAHSGLTLDEVPTLFLEFHGTTAGAREQVQLFEDLAKDEGGRDLRWAEQPEDRNRLWKARHDAYWAALELRPGAQGIATDVCVPISRLAECLRETHADAASLKLLAPIAGHVGDGNFHVLPLIRMDDAAEVERAKEFLHRLTQRALDMDGTCTGEHGIGSGKMAYMEAEHGPGIAVMQQIKKALDPKNILNPGKIFPFP